MTRLHERTGKIVGRTSAGRGSRAIVQFDDPMMCCGHPLCEVMKPRRQQEVMFGLHVQDTRAVEGAEVVTYWMTDGTRGGLAGEVVG